MSRNRLISSRVSLAAAIVGLIAGCSGGETSKLRLPEVTPVTAAPIAAEITPPAASQPGDAPRLAAARFKPPYAGREELFQPPVKPGARTDRQEVGGDVALRGFLNVDGMRALLAVNGRTKPVAAGEQLGGIEVIAIEPPRVTLQRGRVRWVESIVGKQ